METQTKWYKNPNKIAKFLYAVFFLTFLATAIVCIAYGLKPHITEKYLLPLTIITSVFVSIAGSVFTSIWRKTVAESSELTEEKLDYGLIFLSLAMACWNIGGFFGILYRNNIGLANDILNAWLAAIISTVNSTFFLLSIYYFIHNEKFFNTRALRMLKINKENYRRKVMRWSLFVVVIITVLSLCCNVNLEVFDLPGFVDALLMGIITLLSLSKVLWDTFNYRDLKLIGYFSYIIMGLTLAVQFWRAFPNMPALPFETYQNIDFSILVIYKTLMVMIFYALAFSWSFEKYQNNLKEIQVLNDEIKNERFSMNHTIRTSLRVLDADLYLYQNYYKREEKIIQFSNHFRQRVDDILSLHDHMHNYKNQTDTLNTKKYFSERAILLRKSLALDDKNFKYDDSEFDDMIAINDENQIRSYGSIASELVQNAKKYSRETLIKIELKISSFILDQKHFMNITVSDRGEGFNVEPLQESDDIEIEESELTNESVVNFIDNLGREIKVKVKTNFGLDNFIKIIGFYHGNYFIRNNNPGSVISVNLPISFKEIT